MAYDLEPLGCVRFVHVFIRLKPHRSCFVTALLEVIQVQCGSEAFCWLSLTVLCLLWPGQRERHSRGMLSGWALGSAQALPHYKLLGQASGIVTGGWSTLAPVLCCFVL